MCIDDQKCKIPQGVSVHSNMVNPYPLELTSISKGYKRSAREETRLRNAVLRTSRRLPYGGMLRAAQDFQSALRNILLGTGHHVQLRPSQAHTIFGRTVYDLCMPLSIFKTCFSTFGNRNTISLSPVIKPQALYVKATKLELEGNFDRAFQLYIKCAEEQLRLSRLSNNAAVRDRHKSEAGKALERAEKIRSKKRELVTPIAKDHFSEGYTGEQLRVLQQSSIVNGAQYPIWDNPVVCPPSVDTTNPQLSPIQIAHGATWQEPSQSQHTVCASDDTPRPEDIVQHVVSDCSLCASVAVCINHDLRFGSKLGKLALYPQDAEGIDIDTQLPAYPDGELMCMSAGEKADLWPSLIEKAACKYMKLMGGYDFPGSLSTTDLHTLTGWIPETIEISSSQFERERTWNRISKAYVDGTCVLTVGTGTKLPEEHLLPLPLLPAHCYAIIGISDDGEERLVTILDNWIESAEDKDAQTLGSKVEGMRLQENEQSRRSSHRSQLCTVSWDTICTVFDVLLVNWDPSIFKNCLSFHGIWTKDMLLDDSLPQSFQARLSVQSDSEADVWILLTRHVVDSRKRNNEYISLDAEVEDEGSVPITGVTITGALASKTAGGNPTLSTFMLNPQYSLKIHPDKSASSNSTSKSRLSITLAGDRRVPFNAAVVWSQGQRITDMSKSDIALSTGAYKFGHASSVKALRPGDYTVIVSAFEPRQTGPFSLKINCSTRIEVTPIPQEGSGMTADSAAGGPSFNKYTSNPVYELKLPSQSQVIIRLQLVSPDGSTAINVTLFRMTSRRTLGAHLATSGPYSDAICGVATPQITLQPGSYFIIPSTYNPGVQAGFKLIVYTSASVIVDQTHLAI
ncbi:hypothetical protein BC629DRAFT_1435043 [Irpex lacteus]|nr:hypothetical protein BC629DRAFT_1435043 [Irpex lacteus]